MDLDFYGANCFRVATKKANLVFDDNLAELGLKSTTKPDEIALFTHAHTDPKVEVKLVIDQPGEFEVSDVSVQGIAARAHTDEPDATTATIFKIVVNDIRLVVTGHIYPELSDEQLEAIGMVDILLIPVGGNGYTLDPVGALKLIKKIEPKIVIPAHYADKDIKYEVVQQSLEEAVKGLAMEPRERLPKLKLKPADLATEGTQLIILERQ